MDIESAARNKKHHFLPNIQDLELIKKVSLNPNNDQINENGNVGYEQKL